MPVYPPAEHQVIGTEALVRHKYFALFDDPGTGKSKQVVDALDVLFRKGEIDGAIIIAPAQCRSVWSDMHDGELIKHSESDLDVDVVGSQGFGWTTGEGPRRLKITIVSYETIRNDNRVQEVLKLAAPRCMLVLDESHCVKTDTALQTVNTFEIRQSPKIFRVVLLTGSPCDGSPLDLYSQFAMLDKSIVGCKNFHQFRGRYTVRGGEWNKVLRYKNLKHLNSLVAPYILRRLEEEVWDLPDRQHDLTPIPLTPRTWQLYQQMRSDLVAYLDKADPNKPIAFAKNAAVAATRLSQICSGYLPCDNGQGDLFSTPVSTEKFDSTLAWAELHAYRREIINNSETILTPDRLLIWVRFRYEADEITRLLQTKHTDWEVQKIVGGQSAKDRTEAVKGLAPGLGNPTCPTVTVGNAVAGKQGLNLSGAAHVLYVSRDWSLLTKRQSEKRTHRKGQTRKVWYNTLLATGPQGEKTIDSAINLSLDKKHSIASWTASQWKTALAENQL